MTNLKSLTVLFIDIALV